MVFVVSVNDRGNSFIDGSMNKFMLLVLAGILLVVGVGGFMRKNSHQNQTKNQEDGIKIVATFYPLQQLVLPVIGEKGSVKIVVPSGMEPHDYEPSLADIRNIFDADLFLLNGAGIDAWAEKLLPELESKGVKTLRLADAIPLLPSQEDEEHGHGSEESEEEHEHGEWDPHFWLDPILAQAEVRLLTQSLVQQFPQYQQFFEANRDQFLSTLNGIDEEYKQGLSRCQKQEVITSHDAFRYLASRYGFTTHALAGLSPEEEPSSRRLADLAREVRAEGIQYIFFETLVSPKIAETLARETGASTLVFNPIEGVTEEEAAQGINYISLMRDNLAALQKALQCE